MGFEPVTVLPGYLLIDDHPADLTVMKLTREDLSMPMGAGDNTGAPSAFWQAVDIPRARMLADQMNVFGPERATIENQYGTARENILSRVPRGGDLSRLLTTNEMGRARNASVMSLTWELSAPRIVAFEHAEQSRA